MRFVFAGFLGGVWPYVGAFALWGLTFVGVHSSLVQFYYDRNKSEIERFHDAAEARRLSATLAYDSIVENLPDQDVQRTFEKATEAFSIQQVGRFSALQAANDLLGTGDADLYPEFEKIYEERLLLCLLRPVRTLTNKLYACRFNTRVGQEDSACLPFKEALKTVVSATSYEERQAAEQTIKNYAAVKIPDHCGGGQSSFYDFNGPLGTAGKCILYLTKVLQKQNEFNREYIGFQGSLNWLIETTFGYKAEKVTRYGDSIPKLLALAKAACTHGATPIANAPGQHSLQNADFENRD